MDTFKHNFRNFFRKGDMILLLLCLAATAFGILMIASTTNHWGYTRYVVVQLGAAGIGVLLYAIISSVDAEFFSEHRLGLVIFNCFLLLLLIPFGTDNNTGNRSWLDFPLLPIDIQPAEICKITFVLVMASVMASHRTKVSGIRSVVHMLVHLGLLFGLNMVVSRDAGVSLIFLFIFIGMAFAGGVSFFWFLLAGGGIAVVWPVLWNQFMTERQRNRFRILYDASVDPHGVDERYHSRMSLQSLTGGGMMGQGLFQGNRTQDKEDFLFAQHTDYIFSAIGEELGFLGCAFVLLLMIAIIGRCIYVGIQSQDYMRRMICFGAASALIFQVTSNIGMCIGVTPVIGLTLPFISYGGSSIVSLYALLGLVSGVHARPSPTTHELYIQPHYR